MLKSAVAIMGLFLSGCFAALPLVAAPAVEGATSMAGTAGSTASGVTGTQSMVELNNANIEYIKAQTHLLDAQTRTEDEKRTSMLSERATTVGILRDTAKARHDPMLETLAMWVEEGGDPDYAMKYMLHPKDAKED